MANSVVYPRAQFFADNGRPLIGGRIHTYVAGSSTRAPTYKDAQQAQPNTNPIILDGRGEASIYLAKGVEYKFVVEDDKGALVTTQEPVYGAVWPSVEEWPSDATTAFKYAQEALAAAAAIGPIRFFDTLAAAQSATPTLTEGDVVEISADESQDGVRSRRKFIGGVLVPLLLLDYPLRAEAAVTLLDYTALRAYAGSARTLMMTRGGIAGAFQLDAADVASADNGGTIIVDGAGRRWKRAFTGPADVAWFGAVPGIDSTAAFVAAQLVSNQVMLPAGTWVTRSVDTSRLVGPGDLKSYAESPRVTPPALRKDWSNGNRSRQPFEDEFSPHAVVDGAELYYTAFGSAIMINGVELYAVRTGYEHTSNFGYKSVLHLYRFRRDANPCVEKQVIYTTTLSEDIRDVNISPHPSRAGFALISFAEKRVDGSYQARLIVWNENMRTIESNRLLSGVSGADFKWGNCLITPSGYLIFAAYAIDGTAIRIYRSTAALGAGTGAISMAVASTITDTVASEPTIGYWRDKLVLFYRRTGAASKLTYSYEKEGGGTWAATVYPYGLSAHCPGMLAYCNAETWTAFFGLGTDRRIIGATSSQNLRNFKGTQALDVTGGVTGGYPSIIDVGGYYATSTYSEHHDKPGDLKRTRFDRIEIPKSSVDVGPSDPGRVNTIALQPSSPGPGAWIGTPLGASMLYTGNGLNYETEFMVSKSMAVGGISWFTAFNAASGIGSAYIEIYEDGTLVSTSNANAEISVTAGAMVFDLPSNITLQPLKKYRARLKGVNQMKLFDLRHDSKITTVGVSGPVEYTNAYRLYAVSSGN